MEHDKVDELFDEQFERAVKEQFLIDIPHPRVSWDKVSQRLSADRQRRYRRRMIRFVTISAVSILLGAAAFGMPGVSSAFNPLSELVRGVRGDVFAFFYGDPGKRENPGAKTSAPPDVILSQLSGESGARRGLPVPVETITVEEAKQQTAFELALPAYVPEGYELITVTGFRDGNRQLVRVNFLYSIDETKFYNVQQMQVSSDVEYQYRQTSDSSATNSKDLTINGQQGAIFTFSEGISKMIWSDNGTIRIISGSLSEEEMMKVAASE